MPLPAPWLVVLLAFCAYRVQRFITADSITSDFRVALFRWTFERDPGAPDGWVPRTKVRAYAFKLLTCSVCLGFWSVLGSYALWQHWHGGRWVIVVLSIAGIQATISLHEPEREDDE